MALARQDFAILNEKSLHDARLSVHVQDAWHFADNAAFTNSVFDLIISDLTVAEDASGARFHSIEWYHTIRRLLGAHGVLAVNAVSPQETPEAFWSIFNSMLSAGLHPRPYHVKIPSFTKRGYGHDWGFLLAACDQITGDELDQAVLAEPRMTLIDIPQVRSLFRLPCELFSLQPQSVPAHAGSEVLLHYFRNKTEFDCPSGNTIDAFALDTRVMVSPPGDSGRNLFPPELRTALAECVYSRTNDGSPVDEPALIAKVLELMPALHQFHTPEIVADFLDRPAAFLQSIDIAGLVERLLKRVDELPSQLVEELRHLSSKLSEWSGDYLSLVKL
ncbi:MAG: hypothetical protein ACREMY_30630, partial [bacterium]